MEDIGGMNMDSIDKIVQKILNAGGEAAFLDDLVRETASVLAAEINSEGLESQVQFLIEQGLEEESILSEVE